MPAIHHPERDLKHKEIGYGDLTTWARATTSFRRPECGGRAQPGPSIRNLHALRKGSAAVSSVPTVIHNPLSIVIPPPEKSGSIVHKAIAQCERTEQSLLRTMEICDQMNRRLGLLK